MMALIFLLALFILLFIGVPIAFGMLVSGIVMMYFMDILDAQIIGEYFVKGANNYALMAIPFFILTGEIMNVGGVSKRIVDFAMAFVGHIKGGLGYVTIIAGVIFAGLSGSAVADTAALGAILIPMMKNKGYDINRGTGLLGATGILGTILPPSIPLILFGVAGGVSISQLFMAGIAPGIIIAVTLVFLWKLTNKETVNQFNKTTGKEKWVAFKRAFLALLLPILLIVGLRGGVFTPTEAGVFASVYALLISFIYREIKVKDFSKIFVSTAKTTGVVLFLAAAATVTGYAITVAQIPNQLVSILTSISTDPKILMLLMMIVLLLVGAVMDMTPAVLIFTPVLLPIATSVGIDPVYFGIMMVINLSIGLITPPVGTVLFVGAGIAKISMGQIVRGIWPFLVAEIVILILMVIFPEIIMIPLNWFR